VTPQTEVRVALIAGAFQVVVASVALFGTLATASDRSSTLPVSGTSTTVSSTPSAGASCTLVIREYRVLVRLDPTLIKSLTTAGADGVSPIDVDPDARRCGIDRDALRAMR
jgi:hypothetical protein